MYMNESDATTAPEAVKTSEATGQAAKETKNPNIPAGEKAQPKKAPRPKKPIPQVDFHEAELQRQRAIRGTVLDNPDLRPNVDIESMSITELPRTDSERKNLALEVAERRYSRLVNDNTATEHERTEARNALNKLYKLNGHKTNLGVADEEELKDPLNQQYMTANAKLRRFNTAVTAGQEVDKNVQEEAAREVNRLADEIWLRDHPEEQATKKDQPGSDKEQAEPTAAAQSEEHKEAGAVDVTVAEEAAERDAEKQENILKRAIGRIGSYFGRGKKEDSDVPLIVPDLPLDELNNHYKLLIRGEPLPYAVSEKDRMRLKHLYRVKIDGMQAAEDVRHAREVTDRFEQSLHSRVSTTSESEPAGTTQATKPAVSSADSTLGAKPAAESTSAATKGVETRTGEDQDAKREEIRNRYNNQLEAFYTGARKLIDDIARTDPNNLNIDLVQRIALLGVDLTSVSVAGDYERLYGDLVPVTPHVLELINHPPQTNTTREQVKTLINALRTRLDAQDTGEEGMSADNIADIKKAINTLHSILDFGKQIAVFRDYASDTVAGAAGGGAGDEVPPDEMPETAKPAETGADSAAARADAKAATGGDAVKKVTEGKKPRSESDNAPAEKLPGPTKPGGGGTGPVEVTGN